MSSPNEATRTAVYKNYSSNSVLSPVVETEKIDCSMRHSFELDDKVKRAELHVAKEHVSMLSYTSNPNEIIIAQLILGGAIISYEASHFEISCEEKPEVRIFSEPSELNILIKPHSLLQIFICER